MTDDKTMFVDTNYKLKEEADTAYHFQVKVEENENCLILKAATMCIYFEEELLDMIKRTYHDKEAKVLYKSDIPLRFYTYREFMKLKDTKTNI